MKHNVFGLCRGAKRARMPGVTRIFSRGVPTWVVLAGVLAGCSGESTRTVTSTRRTISDPLLNRYAGNFTKETGTDGSTKIVSARRSRFEGRQVDGYGKAIAKKRFDTHERSKRPWWGKKDYGRKSWTGNKEAADAGRKSWFGSRRAKEGGKMARAAGKSYETGPYGTGAASEAGTKRLGHGEDALTKNRRETSPDPRIIGWEEQRKMSMEQTRGILGR